MATTKDTADDKQTASMANAEEAAFYVADDKKTLLADDDKDTAAKANAEITDLDFANDDF